MHLPRLPLAALAGLCAALGVARAEAADPAKGGMPTIEIASDLDTGEARQPAPDQRKGHIYLGVTTGVTGVAGSVATNTPSMTVAGTGLTVGGLFGVGITRYATLQVFGDRTLYAGPAVCPDRCAGSGFTIGLGLTYHLAQALAFDPWGSYGIAYRQSLFNVVDPTTPDGPRLAQRYQGIDIARIAFGGDFYPTSFFGFGPFVEADFGTNVQSPKALMALPPDASPGLTTYAMFQLGVRIAFDPLRSGSQPASGAKKTGRRAPSLASIGLGAPGSTGAAPGF